MNVSLQKNTDLTRFFMIKPRHPGRLKKQIWVEKTLSESPDNLRQNAYCRNLKWTYEDLLSWYCYIYYGLRVWSQTKTKAVTQ